MSTTPPLFFADDPEILMFPQLAKLSWTKIPPAAWRHNLVSRWSYTWTGQYWKNSSAQRAISSTPSLTSHAVNDQMRRLASNQIKRLTCLHLVSTPKSYSVTEMISNSLRAPYSNRGKEQRQTSRFEPIGNQAVSQTLMADYGNFLSSFRCSDHRVYLTEPTAISKSRQRPKEELLSTTPPLFSADDAEISPPELAKLLCT